MSTKVGLVTSRGSTPLAVATACTRCVFPAPNVPDSATTEPSGSTLAKAAPRAAVSARLSARKTKLDIDGPGRSCQRKPRRRKSSTRLSRGTATVAVRVFVYSHGQDGRATGTPGYAWNELPQPQVLVALGLVNTKPRRSSPS